MNGRTLGLALGFAATPALGAEPTEPNEAGIPCVEYVIRPDSRLLEANSRISGLPDPSYNYVLSAMAAQFPSQNPHPAQCLEAIVNLDLDPESGRNELSLTAQVPVRRMQEPEAAAAIPAYSGTRNLGTLPISEKSNDYRRQFQLNPKDIATFTERLKDPAAELKAEFEAWLNANPMGQLQEAATYVLPYNSSYRMENGPMQRLEWDSWMRETLSDSEQRAVRHELNVVEGPRTGSLVSTENKGGATCYLLPGDSTFVRFQDNVTGREEAVRLEGDCTTAAELTALTKEALARLTEPEITQESTDKPKVQVVILWPKNLAPAERPKWTELVSEAAALASTYVGEYYVPKKELPETINLYVDFRSGRSTPGASAFSFDDRKNKPELTVDRENNGSIAWGGVLAGGESVTLPFTHFPSDFNGGLTPGRELANGMPARPFYHDVEAPHPQAIPVAELEEVLAAAMVQALSPYVGPETSTSVSWAEAGSETAASTENGAKTSVDLGLDHACAAIPVGKNGRTVNVEAEWNLPVRVKFKPKKQDPCESDLGLSFSVMGLDLTVGTSKEGKKSK